MRGVSRASLTDAKEQLAGIGGDVSLVGDELFAVTTLLDGEAALRRLLSDPARAAAARRGLAATLLRGRVSEQTLELVTGLAGARWSEPGDLADAAEQLAVLAIAETADADGTLDELEDELFRFGRVVNAQPELRAILANPFIDAERKHELVGSLLAGKVTPQALRLISQATVHPRGRSLDASLAEYARLAAERRERVVAEVHVAVGLSAEQLRRLAAALAAAYGHDVHLNVVLDPQVVGGMTVRVGDELIDGSMAARLAGLRRGLVA
jgi:F-type H+-transporting ATPase subunit delta